MVKQKKVYLPVGTGGLIRYGEVEESKFKISPRALLYFSIGIGITIVLIKFFII